jgi:hypothetical protein
MMNWKSIVDGRRLAVATSVFPTLLVWTLAFAPDAGHAGLNPIERSISGGLAWIDRHPASLVDGGPLEIIEEMIAFHTLLQNDHDPERRAHHRQRMQQRITQLSRLLTVPFVRHESREAPGVSIITYVIATYLMERYGHGAASLRQIILGILARHPTEYLDMPVYRYWTIAYLQRLGVLQGDPVASFDRVSHTAMIAASRNPAGLESEDPGQRLFDWYAVTHDLLALVDFDSYLGARVRSRHARTIDAILAASLAQSLRDQQSDILAELLICRELLGLGRTKSVGDAVAFLIARQQPDGSWGITKPERQSNVRHGVLTAVSALVVYQSRRPHQND